MKKILSLMIVLLATFVLSGCGSMKLTPAQQAVIEKHSSVYTQVSMWVEKNRVYGTNYQKGLLIPVNSKVKILAINSKAIVFEYKGQKVNYFVISKYTKIDSSKTLDRLFKDTKVDLSKYTKNVRGYIKAGKTVKGMSKEAVLISRGYPPFHQTPSLKSDKWKYWYHRFRTGNIIFKNNKVVKKVGGIL